MIVRGKKKKKSHVALFPAGRRQQVLICDLNISLVDYVRLPRASFNVYYLACPRAAGRGISFSKEKKRGTRVSNRNEFNGMLIEYFREFLRSAFDSDISYVCISTALACERERKRESLRGQ